MKKITITIEHNLTPYHTAFLWDMFKAFNETTRRWFAENSVKHFSITVDSNYKLMTNDERNDEKYGTITKK